MRHLFYCTHCQNAAVAMARRELPDVCPACENRTPPRTRPRLWERVRTGDLEA